MSGCSAFIGLAPPASESCQLDQGHEGPHFASIYAELRSESGAYVGTTASLAWSDLPKRVASQKPDVC